MNRLEQMTWRIDSPPWISVASVKEGTATIHTSRHYASLLDAMLTVHLAPNSRQEIIRARKSFKELHNKSYPVTEEELAKKLIATDRESEVKI
jgi:hypothetical protein